ncbi:MAG: aminotransferase [Emcibacteraceae bacterium]|nr:aminotransferase [Emcibacteraceae bacterium]
MNTKAELDINSYIHPQSNLSAHEKAGPMIITGGEGVHVFDDQGNKYLDSVAGLWCVTLGYNNQALKDAVSNQMDQLPFFQTFANKSNNPTIELAAKLLEVAPVPMSKVIFQNSGSEAVDTAIKLVWYYQNARGKKQKKKIIARHGSYHGTTIAAASLTGLPTMHAQFDLPIEGILHTDNPNFYRFGADGETETEFASRCVDNLEKQILEEGPDTIAAFFAEPVMGTGGVIVPPDTYFDKLQIVLKKYDILLVADEVICGFGRTGNYWGCETYGIKPDMITCAKGLSSAYLPISALLVSDGIYQAMKEGSDKVGIFGHGYTYSGHPTCAAVALETLNQYEQLNTLDNIKAVAPNLQQGLQSLENHPLVGNVRGIGLMACVELVKDKKTKESFDMALMMGRKVEDSALSHGLILRALGNNLVFAPPFIISQAEVEKIVEIAGLALDETLSWYNANS